MIIIIIFLIMESYHIHVYALYNMTLTIPILARASNFG